MKGLGVKTFGMSLKAQENKHLRSIHRYPRNWGGGARPKKVREKSVFYFLPLEVGRDKNKTTDDRKKLTSKCQTRRIGDDPDKLIQ